jgi:hypothetical protein
MAGEDTMPTVKTMKRARLSFNFHKGKEPALSGLSGKKKLLPPVIHSGGSRVRTVP